MTVVVIPFWVEFGIITGGAAILFAVSVWVARRAQRRSEHEEAGRD